MTGANAGPQHGSNVGVIHELEDASRQDLKQQDVPEPSRARGLQLLACFGCKPKLDGLVRHRISSFLSSHKPANLAFISKIHSHTDRSGQCLRLDSLLARSD